MIENMLCLSMIHKKKMEKGFKKNVVAPTLNIHWICLIILNTLNMSYCIKYIVLNTLNMSYFLKQKSTFVKSFF